MVFGNITGKHICKEGVSWSDQMLGRVTRKKN